MHREKKITRHLKSLIHALSFLIVECVSYKINEPQWLGVLRHLMYGIIDYEGNNKKLVQDQNNSLNKKDDDTIKIK